MARKKLARPNLAVAREMRPAEPDVDSALGALLSPAADAPKPPAPNRTANLSASIDATLRDRIDALAYEQKLGKTAIVEGALSMLFEGRTNAQVADALRARGQAFKRRS